MSKDRPRSVQLWPLVCPAAVLWLAWAASVHIPRTWRANDHLYLSFQRGCAGAWYWSPAERPTLGVHDDLSLATTLHGPLANKPFAWCDAWGYGLGCPLWIPALILMVLAARRYAVTTVRDAPPGTRRARRWAAFATLVLAVAASGLLVSANHLESRLIAVGLNGLSVENGALVVKRLEDPPPLTLSSPIASRVTFPGSVSGYIPPSRQGLLWVDLVPDLDTSTPQWRFALPLWPFVLLLGWVAWKVCKKAAFRGIGLCQGCGYSMAGLASGAACPECGRPTASRTRADALQTSGRTDIEQKPGPTA